MVEQRNIVILGASASGLQSAHYVMKHIFPSLRGKSDAKYHVYVLNPSSDFYFRIASPRVATSTKLIGTDKVFFNLVEAFKPYSKDEFTFIQASATGLDTQGRKVLYKRSGAGIDEELPYHALLVATGTRTYEQAFSMSTSSEDTKEAIKIMNAKAAAAKDIIIVGGGPTAVETAGELGEHLNGKPGWFSTPPRKVNITLITAAEQLLPSLRPSIGATAEKKLKQLGVEVLYRTRVADVKTTESGRSEITLAKGNKLEADLYIPAYGVQPNSSWLPESLLNPSGYLETNSKTLRVDAAGPRVYALGDISSYSRNNALDIIQGLPVVMTNMKRDLFAYDAAFPDRLAQGKDRFYTPELRETMIVPIGTGGGVGAAMGWRLPSWAAWLIKGRDYLIAMSGKPTASGDSVKKEFPWKGEEIIHI